MLLHDSLDDAVADISADLPALAAASRNRGLSLRRRRRTLAAVGSVAAVTVLALGAYALVPGADGGGGDPVALDIAAPVVTGPLTGRTAPATDRGVAAALAASVDAVADGTFGRFQGAAYDDEAFAALLFEPSGSGPAGQVMVNVQPIELADGPPYTCADLAPQLTSCHVEELPNGDTLRTYQELDDTEYAPGSQRLAVEVISPRRGQRVVVNALNTSPWADGAHRDRPVLDLEQATEIATQTWWSRDRVPVEYADAGTRLEDFTDANADES